MVQSVLVSCSNAKKRTVCSLKSNVCARIVGLRGCILTERASVLLSVHACVCCARVYARLDVICQMHSGQNDRGLLRTTTVTRISKGLGE